MTQARNLSRLLNKDITTYMYTATAGQTAFTGSDDNSQTLTFDNQSIMVTYNGVMLEKGSEFTVAANTVTLLAGAEVNAEVNVIVFNNASLGGYVKSTGGDIDGGVNITSGHLLVGTTAQEPSVSNDDSGFSVRPVGTASISRTSGPTIDLNRKTTDGQIAIFRKDGTTVGSIGTQGSRLSIGSGDVNLNFNASANSMYPISDPVAGTLSDGVINVGAATARFKDAYLSGGIYLGGTVTANKLDDYEEGTFNLTMAGYYDNPTTTQLIPANYVKIGNIVNFIAYKSGVNNTGASGNMWFSGLPFATISRYPVGGIQLDYLGTYPSNSAPFTHISGTIVYAMRHVSNGSAAAIFHNVNTNGSVYLSGTYQTTA